MTRLQAPVLLPPKENPNLIPRQGTVNLKSRRGRYQNVNVGALSAEERTRVPVKVVQETTTNTHDSPVSGKVVTTTECKEEKTVILP